MASGIRDAHSAVPLRGIRLGATPTLRPDRCIPLYAPQSIYAPKVVACQGVGQPSDLSSITSSAPGLTVCAMVMQ